MARRAMGQVVRHDQREHALPQRLVPYRRRTQVDVRNGHPWSKSVHRSGTKSRGGEALFLEEAGRLSAPMGDAQVVRSATDFASPIRRLNRRHLKNRRVRGRIEARQQVASPEGLEPPTSDLEGRCSIQLSYGLSRGKTAASAVWQGSSEMKWSGRWDSNSRPPGPKPGALPGCATPRHPGRPRG